MLQVLPGGGCQPGSPQVCQPAWVIGPDCAWHGHESEVETVSGLGFPFQNAPPEPFPFPSFGTGTQGALWGLLRVPIALLGAEPPLALAQTGTRELFWQAGL